MYKSFKSTKMYFCEITDLFYLVFASWEDCFPWLTAYLKFSEWFKGVWVHAESAEYWISHTLDVSVRCGM